MYALEYARGDRGVVVAHGGSFTKESWQNQAPLLVRAGFRVLAIDFRGRGQSRGGRPERPDDDGLRFDVLAAVRYLRQTGARTVSLGGVAWAGAPPQRLP